MTSWNTARAILVPLVALVVTLSSSPATSTALAAPIQLAGDSLTEHSWNKVNQGVWLVEHYSPYCSHCRAFAPKWQELVEMYSLTAPRHAFSFAQVDCAANGDLCADHNVKYYPSIFLYEDGKFKEEYMDKRSVEALARYVERNWRDELVDKAQQDEEEGSTTTTTNRVRPRPAKGAEKARLPKPPSVPVLHVEPDEGEEVQVEGDDEAEGAYEALLADASKNLFPPPPTTTAARIDLVDHDETLALPPLTSSQTPAPSNPSSSSSRPSSETDSGQDRFVAQQPYEKKRSSSSSSSSSSTEILNRLTAEWETTRGSPDGTVKALTEQDAERLKDAEAGPSFVKYYAPWCGHCKKLAPHWADLASSLTGQVHVYEMDCDNAANKNVCRKEKVSAYPTLIFYNRGAVVEYHGRREVGAMKEWALRAVESTTIKPVANEYELKRALNADETIVLMLYSKEGNLDDVALAREAAKSQMGSTPFYASTSPDLLARFSLSAASPPTFLVFKQQQQQGGSPARSSSSSSAFEPSATYALPAKHSMTRRQRIERTRAWLRSAKLPLVSELDGATYPDLYPEDSNDRTPYVAIGVLSRKGLKGEFDSTLNRFKELAARWNEEGQAKDGERKGEKQKGLDKTVVWAWVDGDRWAPWARSSYDVKMGALDGPVVVIADPHNRVYWKNDLEGSPLGLDSDRTLFDLIEKGVMTGLAPSISSDGFIGRWSTAFVKSFSSLFSLAMSHPFLFFLLLVSSWIGFWFLMKRLFAPGASSYGGAGGGGGAYSSVPGGGGAFKADGGFVKKD
ncbi:hypothetical protein JCM10212_002179 [Sporobolomyces blumeae]